MRVGNPLIRFLSESLIFCEKMSKWAIHSKKRVIRSFAHFWWATWAINSFLMSDLSKLLMVAHFWWATWVIHSHPSFLVCDLRDSLTLLINPLISMALFLTDLAETFRDCSPWSVWNFLNFFLKICLLISYLSFKIFQSFWRIKHINFLFFYCHLAVVLLNSTVKMFGILYPFLSYAKINFYYFSKIILNLT